MSLKMLFPPRLCSPKELLWSRYLKRFIHSSYYPWQPYPLPPSPRPPPNHAEWLSGAEKQPSSYTPCQAQALSLKQATFVHWLPLNSSFSSEPFLKKSRSPSLWMPSLPRSHVSYFLLPLSSVTQQIYLGTGSGFASQNLGCKSFLYLKGIKSISVPTFYQLHAVSAESLMSVQASHRASPHHRHADTWWNSVPKSHHLP